MLINPSTRIQCGTNPYFWDQIKAGLTFPLLLRHFQKAAEFGPQMAPLLLLLATIFVGTREPLAEYVVRLEHEYVVRLD